MLPSAFFAHFAPTSALAVPGGDSGGVCCWAMASPAPAIASAVPRIRVRRMLVSSSCDAAPLGAGYRREAYAKPPEQRPRIESRPAMIKLVRGLLGIVLLGVSTLLLAASPDRNAWALTGGRVIAAPGKVFESG